MGILLPLARRMSTSRVQLGCTRAEASRMALMSSRPAFTAESTRTPTRSETSARRQPRLGPRAPTWPRAPARVMGKVMRRRWCDSAAARMLAAQLRESTPNGVCDCAPGPSRSVASRPARRSNSRVVWHPYDTPRVTPSGSVNSSSQRAWAESFLSSPHPSTCSHAESSGSGSRLSSGSGSGATSSAAAAAAAIAQRVGLLQQQRRARRGRGWTSRRGRGCGAQ